MTSTNCLFAVIKIIISSYLVTHNTRKNFTTHNKIKRFLVVITGEKVLLFLAFSQTDYVDINEIIYIMIMEFAHIQSART